MQWLTTWYEKLFGVRFWAKIWWAVTRTDNKICITCLHCMFCCITLHFSLHHHHHLSSLHQGTYKALSSVLPVTKLSPYIALNSSNLLPSTILAITWKRCDCLRHSLLSKMKTIIIRFPGQLLIISNNNMATKHLSVSEKRFSLIYSATKWCWHIYFLTSLTSKDFFKLSPTMP